VTSVDVPEVDRVSTRVKRYAGWLVVGTLLAPAAQAVWLPVFTPSYIQLRPGETVSVRADRVQEGIGLGPLVFPVTFVSGDPTIATVEGSLTYDVSTQVRITAHQPGVTRVRILEAGDRPLFPTAPFIVVAEQELAVEIGVDGVVYQGHEIRLKAIADQPDATFTWYRGRLNGWRWPSYVAGEGRDFTFVPDFTGGFDYWVLMTTPQGAGAAGITVNVLKPPPARRRSAGH